MANQTSYEDLPCGVNDAVDDIKKDIRHHLLSNLGADPYRADAFRTFKALAFTVRDHLIRRWVQTQRSYYDENAKRVYYLSLEFLLGRLLSNCLMNLKLYDRARAALVELGFNWEDIEEQEVDAGLGNGGLGRLAACFLDSIATLALPGYGYGILYDYGMFHQKIVDGRQIEQPEKWLRYGNPWEVDRPEYLYLVRFGGRVEAYVDDKGRLQHNWVDTDDVMAMPCDVMIPGYGNDNVINLRLWSAKSTHDFNLEYFQKGNYIQAVEDKAISENISKVLYPSEEVIEGRTLRLKQEYFFVAATFQDIVRRFKKRGRSWQYFPDLVAVQLNDTHPTLAIPELMRILVDEEEVGWEDAWEICVKTFGYTNHTVMPEALETWPVDLVERVLPRHLEIIYEINRRFLDDVTARYPGDLERLRRMSLIQETPERRVRMANLAVIGSHSVNGVSAVHTGIIKTDVFKDFYDLYPERFNNKTNGVTPRRWLLQANPGLAGLINGRIGQDWIVELDRLRDLIPLAQDPMFRAKWWDVKFQNKKRLAQYILEKGGPSLNLNTLFDVHVKRMHEYKRQLLNVLHVITMYNRLRDGRGDITPRTVIFGGKAAPGYKMAKLIIKLINAVAEKINRDEAVDDRLKVAFVPNYSVTGAEIVIPGAELSEQISTAGTEASGTGNMKFSLNGALTVGTLDGANIEIMEAVGRENIFIFGLTTAEVNELRARGYNSWDYYHGDEELKRALNQIAGGDFSPDQSDLFQPIVDSLLSWGDRFLVLADYRAYIRAQEEIGRAYLDQENWTRRSILNVANMGRFSTDWVIRQYAEEIWKVKSIKD
ncbi:MAG: glycogen/starch/alpha-glucan phosphorylase [Thermodesulfobacteriota bacterium]